MKLISVHTLNLLCLLACNSMLMGQSAELATMNQQALVSSGNMIMTFNTNTNITVGSPYMHNEWLTGEVRGKNGTFYTDIRMKFEAVNGMLAIINQADSVYMSPDFVREFRYQADGETFVFRNGYEVPEQRISPTTYLRVLYETSSGTSLYQLITKEFREADRPEPYATNRNPNNYFQVRTRYLVRDTAGSWRLITPTRRTIDRLFPDNGGQVNRFVRANNLDYTRAEHLQRIFEHMAAGNP